MTENVDPQRKLRKAVVEQTLPFDIGNIRNELAERSIMATFDWRIRQGAMNIYLHKRLPWWMLWFKRQHIRMRFVLKVESASGLLVSYPIWELFVRRDKVTDTINTITSICQSNVGASRHIEHGNENIRQLAYIKQTDFREVPIAVVAINARTGESIAGIGTMRSPGAVGVPAFMRNPADLG